ncbi:MAG: universal stress protein [Chloroflexota bacterium]
MYHTLFVPLDGSSEAERPLLTVALLADACAETARVLLVRSAAAADAAEGERAGPAHVRAMEDAEDYLRAIAAPLTQTGIEVSAVTSYGDAAETILTQAISESASVITMATHGRWGMDRLLHGSLAEVVVAGATQPVLLFGPEMRAEVPIRRMLIPLDGGPFTAAVLPEAGRFAQSFGIQRIDLLAILPPQTVHVDDLEGAPPAWALEKMGVTSVGNSIYALDARQTLVQDRLQELEHALGYWSDWLHDSAAEVRVHARYELGQGSTAASILKAASELESDMIVMRTHARRGIARALTGSVADEVVRTSSLPVLLYTTRMIEALASGSAIVNVSI